MAYIFTKQYSIYRVIRIILCLGKDIPEDIPESSETTFPLAKICPTLSF